MAKSYLSSCLRLSRQINLCFQQIRWRRNPSNIDIARWNGEVFEREKKHLETPEYPGLFNGEPPAKGKVYDKKPFKMQVEAGKTYLWCSCGLSKSQPFCDKSHYEDEGTAEVKTRPRLRPVRYKPTETKVVYFCNCKQTSNRPLCDNTHQSPEVAEAYTIFRN